MKNLCFVGWLVAALPLAASSAPKPVAVPNGSFEQGDIARAPKGWRPYGGRSARLKVAAAAEACDGRRALLLYDDDPAGEVGVYADIPVKAGECYRASVMVRRVKGAPSAGAYLQMRFLPSNRLHQAGLYARPGAGFQRVSVTGVAPPGTRWMRLYLYTHKEPTPKVIVDDVRVVAGAPRPAPDPRDVQAPVYKKLKKLYLRTDLVKDGKPHAVIVAPASGRYADAARAIQEAIRSRTGAALPIVSDASPRAAVPIVGDLIALGNRSTNKTIEELYNRFYTLLDLRYPGKGGSVVRTLHNPFGKGRHVVFVGGSDDAGVARAARTFIEEIQRADAAPGRLSIGRLARIRLGEGVVVPTDVREMKIWDASKGYRSVGYFGWNSLSKNMAAYYMTGDPRYAREFLRLAFPDKKALQDISAIDGERIEIKPEPLSGPYHYNAHMMILFWDLIEESPVFTDAQRLRITNAFSKQLMHRRLEGVYGLRSPASRVGSRHGQWAAISLYCLGRYFQKDYPNPIWAQCVRGAQNAFASLHKYAWVAGENDNLFWYNTAIAPVLTYMLLSGDREAARNGVLRTLLRGQEILYDGVPGHWSLRSASIGFLHKAAYLTQDGRWIWYRQQTGVDTSVFRLGQSYWPEKRLAPKPPTDLVGKWSLFRLSKPKWRARHNGFKWEESFEFGSFRTEVGPGGDFILIDGYNGASRNPYHCFAILEERLRGTILLAGYRNQVRTRMDGLVEPHAAMNAALKYCRVVGGAAVVTAEVPDMPFCSWRRTLVHRIGRYALVADDLAFRESSDNMEVQILWEKHFRAGRSLPAPGVMRLRAAGGGAALPPGWKQWPSLQQTCRTNMDAKRSLIRLTSLGITLLRATRAGEWLEMPFQLDRARDGEWFVELLNYKDRGKVRFLLDGEPAGKPYDHFAQGVASARVPLGRRRLAAGRHVLRVTAVGHTGNADKCFIGLAGVMFNPAGSASQPAGAAYEVCLSDPVAMRTRGAVTTMQWLGPVEKGGHRHFFSLLAPAASAEPVCCRLAANAAALALPEPAVAAAGKYQRLEGELVVLSSSHLFGEGITRAGAAQDWFAADSPVNADWNFKTGRLVIDAAQPAVLRVRLADAAGVRVDEKPAALRAAGDGLYALRVGKGATTITGARPPANALAAAQKLLAAQLAAARRARAAAAERLKRKPVVRAPKMKTVFRAQVPGWVQDLIAFRAPGGLRLAAAEGKTIHLFDAAGKALRAFHTPGKIRMVRWWPEYQLLLAGCADERVVAFGLDGRQRWTFTSVMDPAVFRAAKTYWFKSALPGIHGLYTGELVKGKSWCFVGSACTLEILDGRGRLVKRMPLFWGKNSLFQIIDAPDGSRNLLVARVWSGTHGVSLVNSKDLKYHGKSFTSVPPGCTYVGGWSSLNRRHLYYVDLDGDGKKEVVSEINGTWNRVTVWDAKGRALYDASFGPGDKIPARNMRDLAVCDLDGDGKKEILAATSAGLLVALDCRCRKLWAKRLPSPAEALQCVSPAGGDRPVVVAACDNGRILAFDARGVCVAQARVRGRPTRMTAFGAGRVAVGTRKGAIAALAP